MFVQSHHSLEELQRLTKALTKKRIWLRHQAVVLAKQGHSAPAIARALGCSRRAVQAWVGRYNQGGLAALQERPHTGRPPRLAAADVPRFRDRLEAGPTPEDGNFSKMSGRMAWQLVEYGHAIDSARDS